MIDNYADLPLGRYLDIEAVSKDTDRDELDRQVAIVALLSGIAEKDLLALPIADYSALAAKTAFLGQPCPEGRTARQYIVGDYTLIPTDDLTKITTAQYIDFQTYAPEGAERFVEILSVFLIPKGHKYNDGLYDIPRLQGAIREHLSVADAITLSAFFLRKFVALMRATQTSSERLAKGIKDPRKRLLAMKAAFEARERMKATLSVFAGVGLPT